jgi:hypothetical protein
MKLRFPKLAAAVAAYERTLPQRQLALAAANTESQIRAALAQEDAALHQVRLAYADDDRNPNSRDRSMLLNIETARAWARLTLR